MAVRIRLKRTGAKNDACYRLVAADERSPRDGRNLEILGWYDPAAKGETFSLKLDRVDHWLGVGAQISDTAASLVKKARKAPAPVVVEAEPVVAPEEPVVEAEVTEAEAAEAAAPETASEPEAAAEKPAEA